MKMAFDEEVSSDKADEFFQALNALRWPTTVPQTVFAFSTASSLLSTSLGTTSAKHRFGTIRLVI